MRVSTALITGATSGIGAEFAAQLAARGEDLVLVARNEDRLAETAERLHRAHGIDVEILPADLNDRAQTLMVAERLTDQSRPIDRLVNNAGFGLHGRLLDEDLMAETDPALEVMLASVILLGGAAARAMAVRGTGTIINISSAAGFVHLGTYSAIKAAVTAYSESLAVELSGTGVTATALCPGWVKTEFHERAGISTSKIPAPMWIEAPRLVRDCLNDADKGKVLSIPTPLWKVAIALTRILPRSILRSVSGKIRSGRR